MNKVPMWKIKREIIRVFRVFFHFFIRIFKDLYFRRWYDFVRSRSKITTKGILNFSGEVAIYLIYPKFGVLASHLDMLDELMKAGIAPIVVSNLPLSQADLQEIEKRSAIVIQRPNVGYDFGGYRDGILSIANDLHTFKRLWILNDSVWYIPHSVSWFDKVRLCDEDFIGASSTLTRGNRNRYQDVKSYWPYEKTHPLFHYGSFALSIGPRILSDPKFVKFWRKLKITDNKAQTVMRGEIGLSQWAIRNGYSHRATSNLDRLDLELDNMTIVELRSIFEKLILLESKSLQELRDTVNSIDLDDPDARSILSSFILFATCRCGFAYALAAYAIEKHGFHFLKKLPLRLNPDSYKNIKQIAETVPGRIGDNIREEIESMPGALHKS